MNKHNNFQKIFKHLILVGVLMVGACLLGVLVINAGDGGQSKTLAAGAVALCGIGAVICLALELPLITGVRYLFLATFFIKLDFNVYKLDELEDPSGLNFSLTLLTAVSLLVYDHFTDSSREKIFPATFSIGVSALLLSAVVSVVCNDSNALGWFSVWSFLTSIAIAYAMASHFSRRERMVELIVGVAVGLLFTGIVAFSQHTFDFPTNLPLLGTGTEDELVGTQVEVLSRAQSFLRTPTEMAWVISMFIPVVLAPLIGCAGTFKYWQKLILPAGLVCGSTAIILSLARGSWIGFVISVGAVLLGGWYGLGKKEKKTYFSAVGATVCLALVFLAPFAGRIIERLTEDDEGSAMIRIPLMETAVRIIGDNPLVGVGMNNYRTAMPKYDETAIFVSKAFPNPVHNVFAHITAEIGIPGGIIFTLLIAVALFECYKAKDDSDRLLFAVALGVAAGLLAFVISGIKEPGSLGSGRPPLRTLFFLFGVILAVSRLRRQLYN